jgi:hypothetical protein
MPVSGAGVPATRKMRTPLMLLTIAAEVPTRLGHIEPLNAASSSR